MKYIDEIDISNKKVILRCDYNVPIDGGKVVDNSRIVKSLITIKYLLAKNCSIVILSHLGRVKSEDDKLNNSLLPVKDELSKLLDKDILFFNKPYGLNALESAKNLLPGQIMLLENTRFLDFPDKLESNNDENLSHYWSAFGDVFVVDAFGSFHRAHASVAGISKFIPTYFGLLVKEEMTNLTNLTDNIQRPFSVFMGGAKVDDKLKYIESLLPKCDYLMLGGGIANSFLLALGYDIGDSLACKDDEILLKLKTLYEANKEKIILPVDFVIKDNKILDLNSKTINKYVRYLAISKTIFVNGTCGKFEEKEFASGTVALFKNIKAINAIKIAGGGDTLNAINKYNLNDCFTFLSTGGGATLEFVSKNTLEAIDFIESK